MIAEDICNGVGGTTSEVELKDFLVFRLDEKEGYDRELAGESNLEAEAIRFACLVADSEWERGISYEVRHRDTAALLFSITSATPTPTFC